MTRVVAFAPLIGRAPRVLILGSLPGAASLAANEYYAHPRNAFWPIMAALLGFDVNADYAQRVAALKAARIALWDVLHSCTRPGSLDADIVPDSLVANDLPAFLQQHPAIQRVFFNGAKAEACFRKHIAPSLAAPALQCMRLPSTSPAHAALSFERKLAAWRVILAERP